MSCACLQVDAVGTRRLEFGDEELVAVVLANVLVDRRLTFMVVPSNLTNGTADTTERNNHGDQH